MLYGSRVSSLQKNYTVFILKNLGVARSFVLAKEMNTVNSYYLRVAFYWGFSWRFQFVQRKIFLRSAHIFTYTWLPTFIFASFPERCWWSHHIIYRFNHIGFSVAPLPWHFFCWVSPESEASLIKFMQSITSISYTELVLCPHWECSGPTAPHTIFFFHPPSFISCFEVLYFPPFSESLIICGTYWLADLGILFCNTFMLFELPELCWKSFICFMLLKNC